MNQTNNQKLEDSFWNSDLTEIEKSFLPEGKKIVDLPVHLDDVVPAQGSVLLRYAKKYDVK